MKRNVVTNIVIMLSIAVLGALSSYFCWHLGYGEGLLESIDASECRNPYFLQISKERRRRK